MNVAREFKRLNENFCAGLSIIQSHNQRTCVEVMVEDENLIWIFSRHPSTPMGEFDANKLRQLGFEFSLPENGDEYGTWSYRFEIPAIPAGYKCQDRLNTEREIEELHAQF